MNKKQKDEPKLSQIVLVYFFLAQLLSFAHKKQLS